MSRQFNSAVLDEFKIRWKDAKVWVEPSRCSAPFLSTHTRARTHARTHASYSRAEKMIFLLDLVQAESCTHIKKLVIAWQQSKEPVAAYIHKVY
jgi:hypothetical protein